MPGGSLRTYMAHALSAMQIGRGKYPSAFTSFETYFSPPDTMLSTGPFVNDLVFLAHSLLFCFDWVLPYYM